MSDFRYFGKGNPPATETVLETFPRTVSVQDRTKPLAEKQLRTECERWGFNAVLDCVEQTVNGEVCLTGRPARIGERNTFVQVEQARRPIGFWVILLALFVTCVAVFYFVNGEDAEARKKERAAREVLSYCTLSCQEEYYKYAKTPGAFPDDIALKSCEKACEVAYKKAVSE